MFSASYNYRLWFLVLIAKFFLPPLLIARVISRTLSFTLNTPLSALLYVSTIFAVTTLKVQWTRFMHRRDAAQRGAVLAPVIKGKWPGNIDLLLSCVSTLQAVFEHINNELTL